MAPEGAGRLIMRSTHEVVAVAAIGTGVGLGHAMRAHSILMSFAAEGTDTTLVLQWRGDDAQRNTMEKRFGAGMNCVVIPDLEEALKYKPGALLLTDIPEGHALPFARIRKERGSPVVCLNAYGLPDEHPDAAFLRGMYWEHTTHPEHQWAVGGATFEVLSKKIQSLRPAHPWSSANVNRILLTCGAADPGEISEAAIPLLGYLAKELIVVAGPLFKLERIRHLQSLENACIKVVNAPADIASHMLRSDLIISLGGQTTWEAMFLGRPVAMIRWGPTARAADYFVSNGAALDFGTINELPNRSAWSLADAAALRKQAARNFEMVDGKGAARTVAWLRAH